MSKALLRKLSNEELRNELAVWHEAVIGTRVRTFVRMADDRRNAVITEGWRRDRDFWRREERR